jgi:transaldolase
MHVIKASKAGANVITVPLKVLEQMFEHPLTTAGIELFEKDIQSM